VSRAEKGLRLLPGASLAQIDRHWPTASASPRLSTASVSISKRMIRSWHNAISSNSSQSIWTGSVPECHHTYVSGYSNTTVQPSDGFGALLRRFGAGRPNSRAAVIKNDGVPGPIVIATEPGKGPAVDSFAYATSIPAHAHKAIANISKRTGNLGRLSPSTSLDGLFVNTISATNNPADKPEITTPSLNGNTAALKRFSVAMHLETYPKLPSLHRSVSES
jgi:hypothetical protein